MNILSSHVERAVKWFARWITTNMTSMCYDDAVQEMWIEVLKVSPKYNDATDAAFPTFVWRHLKWRSMNIVRDEITRLKHDTAYAETKPIHYDIPENNKLLETIQNKLKKPLDQRVLKILVDPPEALFIDRPTASEHLPTWKLASYLGISACKVDRSRNRIKKVAKRIVNG